MRKKNIQKENDLLVEPTSTTANCLTAGSHGQFRDHEVPGMFVTPGTMKITSHHSIEQLFFLPLLNPMQGPLFLYLPKAYMLAQPRLTCSGATLLSHVPLLVETGRMNSQNESVFHRRQFLALCHIGDSDALQHDKRNSKLGSRLLSASH